MLPVCQGVCSALFLLFIVTVKQFFQILPQHWSLGSVAFLVIELRDHLIEQLF